MDRDQLYKEIENQKEEMTPSERMREYLKGNEVDLQPYGLLSPKDALSAIWGFTKGDARRSFEVRCEQIRRLKEEYGIGSIKAELGLRGIGEAVGSEVSCPENSFDYISRHYLITYDRLEELSEFEAGKNPYCIRKMEDLKQLMERFPDMGAATDIAGPLSTAIAIRPIEMVLRDMSKKPEKVHRLLDLCVECSLSWVRYFYAETGSSSVGFADPATTTDILGLRMFRQFSKPYLKKLIDGIEQVTGKKPGVHICGHTKQIWEDLAEIGITNLSIDNCESLAEAKAALGDRMFLSGNIAPVEVMRYGTIDSVIKSVKTALKDASDSPSGFMLKQGCQLPIGTPKVNIDAYIYAARKYGKGARLGKKCKGLLQERKVL